MLSEGNQGGKVEPESLLVEDVQLDLLSDVLHWVFCWTGENPEDLVVTDGAFDSERRRVEEL